MTTITKNPISPGKFRALQTTSSEEGIFRILAVDHRDSIRALIDPERPDSVPAGMITELKLVVIEHIAPQASAVMLDPVYSLAQTLVAGALPGQVGFISALEEQGYLGDPDARQTTLLRGWSVGKAKRLGAGGVKLLLFYHPDAGEAAEQQEQVVRQVVADCARYEVPLFLEPMVYSLDPGVPTHSAEFAQQRRRIVIESIRRLTALGPDVLKVPFPLDAKYESDQGVWRDACAELNDVTTVPWAILSGGDPYETFRAQLQVACEAGCSGFMVGRALWREVLSAQGPQRKTVLEEIVLPRFKELSRIATTCGQSWFARVQLPVVDETWFRGY